MKTKIIILLLITVLQIHAEIRFVSKTGTSKPPFTSWATAADSIQKAINICNPGDTVYVGNGVYEEQLIINKNLSLIGSGMDSCIIDTRKFAGIQGWRSVEMKMDVGTISGFHIMTSNRTATDSVSYCLNIFAFVSAKIENMKFSHATRGLAASSHISSISNNIFNTYYDGIEITSVENFDIVVENNYITCSKWAIYVPFSAPTITFKNNTIILTGKDAIGIWGSYFDENYMYNNLVVAENAKDGLAQSSFSSTKINNVVVGKFSNSAMFINKDYSITKNNLLINKDRGMVDYDKNDPAVNAKYNNSWGGINNYYNFVPDSTNYSNDPMIVSEASLDLHLQMFSPMIDAGDPTIIDVDGTRSDIGLYGGPFGESYTYIDLAPRTPRGITGSIIKNKVTLNWAKNTEADLASYTIYRDTVSNFKVDSSKKIAKLADTTFIENISIGKNFYYKLTAIDKQGNESKPSEETGVITGINRKEIVVIEDYILYQNYPNPFNPSTKIGYKMEKPGYVKLNIYDIKGALVKELINCYKERGYYEVEFRGEKSELKNSTERLSSGIYLYSIEIKNENNLPVFMNMKKMIFLK